MHVLVPIGAGVSVLDVDKAGEFLVVHGAVNARHCEFIGQCTFEQRAAIQRYLGQKPPDIPRAVDIFRQAGYLRLRGPLAIVRERRELLQ